MTLDKLETLLKTIVTALVEKPDKIQIKRVAGEHNTIFEVKSDPTDLKYLLGSGGSTADAIRHIIVNASKVKPHAGNVYVDILRSESTDAR